METSDESFDWTDASTDSGSSEDKVADMKQDKSKQVAGRDGAHKNESHSEPEAVPDEERHRQKKRKKHAVRDESDSDNTNNYQINKSIKSEPNSDFEVPKSKKNHKYDETSTSDKHDESLHDAEEYLNLRVKQEQATFVEPTPMKAKKKKKAKEEHNEEQELEFSMPSKDEIEEHYLDSSCLANGDHSESSEIDISSRKKKKKKQKLSREYDTSETLEDSEDSRKKKKKNKKNKELSQNGVSDDDNFQHDVENGQIISSTLIQENDSMQENGREQCNSNVLSVSALESGITTNDHKSNNTEESIKKSCRISDRLRFEEDSVDYEPKDDVPKNDLSIQLEQFISSDINLKPLHVEVHSDPEISDDDDVWIVKAPHDISIGDLENSNLTLDGKKKVKINGNTYDTIIDTSITAAPILLINKRKLFIKNTPLKGVINLRKRIPKIHIPYESLMMNNESSFIPLPDTKCRHPLFGVHYKKAAKVPPAVAERLKSTAAPISADSTKKKKHKEKVEIDSDIELKPNIEELHSNRKKRKMGEKLDTESDSEAKPSVEVLHSKKKKRKSKERLEFESESEEKPSIEVLHSKKKKRKSKERLDSESESEKKPSIEVLHSKKKKRKNKERLETESESEKKPSIEVLHSKKKKRKNNERLETESDSEVISSTEVLHSNKKKRKHSDDRKASKKAKRVKYDPSSADAWESEQAIEKNLFDF